MARASNGYLATIAEHKRVLIGIFATAFVLRVFFLLLVIASSWHAQIFWDSGWEAVNVAASLAAGHGFASPHMVPTGPTAWVAPVYPFLLAGFFRLFGPYSTASLVCILFFNVLCSTATAVATYLLGIRYFGRKTALLAAIAWAVWPDAMGMTARIWESSLSALLATSAIYLSGVLLGAPESTKVWLTWAAFWGFAALVNPALLGIGIVPTAYILIRRPRTLLPASLGMAVILCMTTPWIIRNYVAFHRVIPVKADLGPNFWWGIKHVNDGFPSKAAYAPEVASYVKMGEVPYDDACALNSRDYIFHNPGGYARRVAAHFIDFWTSKRIIGNIPVALISITGIAGFVLLCYWRRRLALLFAGPLLVYPLTYYLTTGFNVYRQPIEPALYLLTFYLAVECLARGSATDQLLQMPPRRENSIDHSVCESWTVSG